MSHTNNTQERAYPQAFGRAQRRFLRRQVVFAFFGLAIVALGLFLVLGRGDSPKSNTAPVEAPTPKGVVAVDMGLSVCWASCNVGAEVAAEPGDYFAWGEMAPFESYVYNNSSTYDKVVEGGVLPLSNDASTLLGEGWRMPTVEEFEELITECEWRLTQRDGVSGYEVVATNGNSIFLPASGYIYDEQISLDGLEGVYWCSNIAAEDDVRHAMTLRFKNRERFFEPLWRYYGAQIRAVKEI
jgi:hypothetical protein